jgi:hypothetical protein
VSRHAPLVRTWARFDFNHPAVMSGADQKPSVCFRGSGAVKRTLLSVRNSAGRFRAELATSVVPWTEFARLTAR